MTRSFTTFIAVAALFVAGSSLAEAHASTSAPVAPIVRRAAPVAPVPVPPLRLVSTSKKSQRLTELEFSTPYLTGNTRVRVLTPVGYDKAPSKRWPVLWLLHGTSLSLPGEPPTGYAQWTDGLHAEAITRSGKFLVVMPEAQAGNYTDTYGLVGEGGPAWESYHLRQLLPWIDAHYRTVPNRAGRAVAGVSMGGGGALRYAPRHPDLFSSAESYSGAVDPTNLSEFGQALPVRASEVNGATNLLGGQLPDSAWGPWATQQVRVRSHGAVDLVGNLRDTVVTLRVGSGTNEQGVLIDPLEWGVHIEAVNLHQALNRAGIAHTYDDYGPGEHTGFYFERDLRKAIEPLNAYFAAGGIADPTSFSYTSAEERMDVYDYHVTSDRGFLEFATLNVAPGRLTLSGSGIFTVTTPRQYVPGARYRLTVERDELVQEVVIKADRSGRLSYAVDTSRRSAGQQYAPASFLVPGYTVVGQVKIAVRRV